MYLLELYQNDYSKDFVVFDSLEDGKDFVSQILGYSLEIEDGFEVEYVNPKHLPDYMKTFFNETLFLYLDFRLILRKMIGKRF